MSFHKYLDRNAAMDLLRDGLGTLRKSHGIPSAQTTGNTPPEARGAMPVSNAEARLKRMLDKAGLTEGEWQRQIRFRHPIERVGFKTTTPDVFYPPQDEDEKGLCLYLDGMGTGITAIRKPRHRTWPSVLN